MKLSETSRAARERNAEAMERIQERRRMAEVVVPALDPDVRKLLRRLGEPVTLFGEREMERRDRLRKLLAGMDDDQREQVRPPAQTPRDPASPPGAQQQTPPPPGRLLPDASCWSARRR